MNNQEEPKDVSKVKPGLNMDRVKKVLADTEITDSRPSSLFPEVKADKPIFTGVGIMEPIKGDYKKLDGKERVTKR